MDKKERKEFINQLGQKELVEFKKGLPIDENVFPKLFDFLDIELTKKGCNHNTILTQSFLEEFGISNISDVIEWLADNGGFCDCEVLANVEDLFDYLTLPIIKPFSSKQIKKQKINSLHTNFGFFIEKIPAPWVLTETIVGEDKVYNFQIGKGNDCNIKLELNFPLTEVDNDEFWTNLWITETELNYNNDLVVDRFDFEDYSVILVKTKNWIPVKIWCFRKASEEWFLKMNTQLSRHKGDLKELEKLIKHINV